MIMPHSCIRTRALGVAILNSLVQQILILRHASNNIPFPSFWDCFEIAAIGIAIGLAIQFLSPIHGTTQR